MSKLFNLVLLSMLLGSGTVFSVKDVTTECKFSEEDCDQYVEFLRKEVYKQVKAAGLDKELMDILTVVLNSAGFAAVVKEFVTNPGYQAVVEEYGVDTAAAARDPRMIAARRRFDEGVGTLFQIEKLRRSSAR